MGQTVVQSTDALAETVARAGDEVASPGADALDPGLSETVSPVPDGLAETRVNTARTRGEARRVPMADDPTRDTWLAEARHSPGALIGRYVVLDVLGAGGMGVVYAGYDPELDRKVALKLLRPELSPGGNAASDAARTRLLREAQALARLSHPNVVAIHDVGEERDSVWLAMEFVDGRTLGAWLDEKPRAWREVLSVFDAAGRGLAAAHAAGLLHRDFKPENVMVGSDGRVRVMDLGLARETEEHARAAASTMESLDTRSALSVRVTHGGALLGTPAYMAPEQLLRLEVDGRADVFAYCVTLWEALYGERPFAGETLRELQRNVVGGKRRRPPRDKRVPGWLRAVCERGLAVQLEARWSSMQALRDAIARGQRRARLKRWAAGGALITLSCVGVAAYSAYTGAQRVSACEAAGDRIYELWNDEARTRLRAGLLATGVPFAATTAEKVLPYIERFASEWRGARVEACLERHVREAWSDDAEARALWCLDERRMALETMVDGLSRADRAAVARAVSAAANLRPVAPCVDEDALATSPRPPPAESRAEALEVVRAIARGRALFLSGAEESSLEAAQRALERAEALGWPPLTAAARVAVASSLVSSGANADAEAASVAAYKEAAKARAWRVAAQAASQLVRIVGLGLARAAEGRAWAEHAEVAYSLGGDPLGLGEARRLGGLARIHYSLGAFGDARDLYERALALRTRAFGPDHYVVAESLSELADVHNQLAEYDEAEALSRRSYELRVQTLGPDHPSVAVALFDLASIHDNRGAYAKALELYEQALVVQQRVLNPTAPEIVTTLSNMARVYIELGEKAKARSMYERVLEIREQTRGSGHPRVGTSLLNLAATLDWVEEADEAQRLLERALGIFERKLGAEHMYVAYALNNLGELHRMRGELDTASTLFERALAIFEKSLGPEHPSTAVTLGNLGDVALDQRRPDVAVRHYERALAIFDEHEGTQEVELEHRFGMARALVESGGDRERALAEARRSAEGWREAGAGKAEELAKVDRWLAEQGEPSSGSPTKPPPDTVDR